MLERQGKDPQNLENEETRISPIQEVCSHPHFSRYLADHQHPLPTGPTNPYRDATSISVDNCASRGLWLQVLMPSTPERTVLFLCTGGRFEIVHCGPHNLAPESQGVRSRVDLKTAWGVLLATRTLGVQEWEELCCLLHDGVYAPPSHHSER